MSVFKANLSVASLAPVRVLDVKVKRSFTVVLILAVIGVVLSVVEVSNC